MFRTLRIPWLIYWFNMFSLFSFGKILQLIGTEDYEISQLYGSSIRQLEQERSSQDLMCNRSKKINQQYRCIFIRHTCIQAVSTILQHAYRDGFFQSRYIVHDNIAKHNFTSYIQIILPSGTEDEIWIANVTWYIGGIILYTCLTYYWGCFQIKSKSRLWIIYAL